jgi:hypothetical protein
MTLDPLSFFRFYGPPNKFNDAGPYSSFLDFVDPQISFSFAGLSFPFQSPFLFPFSDSVDPRTSFESHEGRRSVFEGDSSSRGGGDEGEDRIIDVRRGVSKGETARPQGVERYGMAGAGKL